MSKNFLIYILAVLVIGIFILQGCGNSGNNNELSKKDAALSVIMNRKSVRNFNKERPVKSEDLETIMKAAMAAPSGKDLRPWEFVVVSDRATLDNMAAELPYGKMLSNAPMAIIVCGDTTRSPYWYLDCSVAAQNILLTAEALELGAVWTAAYPYQDRMSVVAKCVGLPPNVRPLTVIPVGYPVGPQNVKDKYDKSRIHTNNW